MRELPSIIRILPFFCLFLLLTARAEAQLRPLDPMDWTLFRTGATVQATIGTAVFTGQRASLAGVEGRLVEWGTYTLAWRTGRVVLDASGTAFRTFEDRARFADPVPAVSVSFGERRQDAGDHRVATTVRLTPADLPLAVALRFGTRLPTTDNTVGLERDQTDFFALVASSYQHGRLEVGGEAGVGLYGTRDPAFEQWDVLAYGARAMYRHGIVAPMVALTGQLHGVSSFDMRGNENLGEVRIGARAGSRQWVEAVWVRGYEPFSPRSGAILSAGMRR